MTFLTVVPLLVRD